MEVGEDSPRWGEGWVREEGGSGGSLGRGE